MERPTVIWTVRAAKQLEGVYKHIAKDSILQADKVFDKIKASTNVVPENPERYPPDKYKINNKGNYRAYEIYRYRISYRITKNTIYVVRLRSTDQNPKEY
jgi:plasmid stabilization system protein ParE